MKGQPLETAEVWSTGVSRSYLDKLICTDDTAATEDSKSVYIM